MDQPKDLAQLDAAVRDAVAKAAVSDIHTHLFYPSHGALLLWGVDELLTYHYLTAELFTVASRELTPEKFRTLSKSGQADLVWKHLFLDRPPISEACRGVITTLNALGLDVAGRDLAGIRKWFAAQETEAFLRRVFQIANVDYAVMTNNPFSPEEAAFWRQSLPACELLKPALRMDALLMNWPAAAGAMTAAGYPAAVAADAGGFDSARRFLAEWVGVLKPVYLAASLGPDWAYPAGAGTKALDEVIVPTAREFALPVALMIGARRSVNPALGDAGDGVGVADVNALANLCRRHADVKFIATVLSRVNQHELCVVARKFANLHVEGCWWFCNNPSIIAETTRMRLEMLGTAFTAQHSDARVADQIIYKWSHTRAVLADVLAETFAGLFVAGWRPSIEDIRRAVRSLLGGAFEEFCRK
ncbi:MAG: glucuronate isomerase [Planctomycetota bacterium]|nr:glucuronate isomerase [Planctomycetota bacterium]